MLETELDKHRSKLLKTEFDKHKSKLLETELDKHGSKLLETVSKSKPSPISYKLVSICNLNVVPSIALLPIIGDSLQFKVLFHTVFDLPLFIV